MLRAHGVSGWLARERVEWQWEFKEKSAAAGAGPSKEQGQNADDDTDAAASTPTPSLSLALVKRKVLLVARELHLPPLCRVKASPFKGRQFILSARER